MKVKFHLFYWNKVSFFDFNILLEYSLIVEKQELNLLNVSELLIQRLYKAFIENNIEIVFYNVYLTTIIFSRLSLW